MDLTEIRKVSYSVYAYRVPDKGDWYINQQGDVVRCKKALTSNHARKRPIVKRIVWLKEEVGGFGV